jgi:hypothetical protein
MAGDDADCFVYRSTDESNAAMRDTIADFEDGVDRLDLSELDANLGTDELDVSTFAAGAGSGVLVGEVSAAWPGADVVVYVNNASGTLGRDPAAERPSVTSIRTTSSSPEVQTRNGGCSGRPFEARPPQAVTMHHHHRPCGHRVHASATLHSQ